MLKNHLLTIAIVTSLIFISFITLNHHRRINTFYFDEVSWICEGRIYNAIAAKDFKSGVWTEDLVQRLNPQLGKLILGWWIMQNFGQEGFDVFNCPNWGNLMHIKNMSDLSLSQQKVIIASRIPMMIFGIISILLIFKIATIVFNPVVGTLSSLLLLFNPLFQTTVNRAMPDSLLLTWYLGFFLFIFYLLKKKPSYFNKLRVFVSIVIGLLIGVGISIKTYGLYAYVFFGVTLCALFFLNKSKQKKIRQLLIMFANMTVVGCISTATVFLLNPVFWFSPKTFLTWTHEWQSFQSWLQKDDWAYKDIALFTPFSRLSELFKAFLYPGNAMPQLFHFGISALILFLGIGFLLQKIKSERDTSTILLLLWFLIFLGILLLYTPFKLDRYYIPLLPPILIIQAYTLVRITNFTIVKLKKLWH